MADIPSWPRPHYEPGDGEVFLWYMVFGSFPAELPPLSRSRYRSQSIDPFELNLLSRAEHAEHIDPFVDWLLGQQLAEKDPDLYADIKRAPQCMVLRGPAPDSPTLDYLRNAVGAVMWLMDNGGAAVLDVKILRYYSPAAWRELFERKPPIPVEHTVVLISEEEDGTDELWFHTRGLIKFARPDLSLRHVPRDLGGAVGELFLRFINLQTLGGRIPEGQEVKLAGLPEGMTCHHGGHADDPDFNNVHVEIRWPADQR